MILSNFFSTYPEPVMKLYSLQHLVPLFLTVFLVFMVYKFRDNLRGFKYESWIRFSLITILVLAEVSIALWRGITGTFNITHTLPLHLCSFSAFAIEIVLLTKSKRIMDYIYYISVGGAFIAMFYPDLRYSFTQFRYLEFFIFHITIIISVFYMVFVHKLMPSASALWKSALVVHLLAIPIIIFNYIVDGSYWMLVNTSVPLLRTIFGEWPKYIIGLELLLVVLFGLNYLITRFLIISAKI